MRPPQRTRNAPEKLVAHPPDSKHELMSVRKKKKYDQKKQRDFKRNQRAKNDTQEDNQSVELQGDKQPAGQGETQTAGQGDNQPAVKGKSQSGPGDEQHDRGADQTKAKKKKKV